MIDSQANLQLVYEESEALVALEKIPELLVDVIVIDHRLQGLNGIELAQRLVDAFSEKGELCPTIIVTGSYATPELVLAAIRSGASDVVTQDAPLSELLTAINNAAQARSLANFADIQEILESADYRPKPDPLFVLRISQLQETEKDLLQLVEDGSTFVEAKDELDLAEIDFQKLIEQVQIKLHMATTEQLLLALHDAR
jgi:DNA-binding NarL/FixJ family response regulator